jgi:hypothetical protein
MVIANIRPVPLIECVETQLCELTALRDELRTLLRNWDALLAKNPPPKRAGLLESLVASDTRRRTRSARLARRPINRKKETKETQW